MDKHTRRSIVISILVICMMTVNFTRLVNSECIRAIHVVTLMVLGAAAYVLIVNLVGLVKRNT